jgi:hypothetical protein
MYDPFQLKILHFGINVEKLTTIVEQNPPKRYNLQQFCSNTYSKVNSALHITDQMKVYFKSKSFLTVRKKLHRLSKFYLQPE